MPDLKLTPPEDLDIIPFPSREERGENRGREEGEELDAIEFARQLESALDDLQSRLDKVRDDLESAYRFPGPEDWPPSAA